MHDTWSEALDCLVGLVVFCAAAGVAVVGLALTVTGCIAGLGCVSGIGYGGCTQGVASAFAMRGDVGVPAAVFGFLGGVAVWAAVVERLWAILTRR